MNELNIIAQTLSGEEQQKFITYLERKNKRSDTKNIQLFKCLAKGESDTISICNDLYNKENRVAYHALRKRLFQSLIDFTANQNLEGENSIDMQVIKYILASRAFLLQKNYKIAYKILDKAEKLADQHFLYAILNEIYHTKIQFAYSYPDANIESLIIKQKANQKKHQLEDQLNIVYSKIQSSLNDISYKGKVIDFETLFNKTLEEHKIKIDASISFKSLYQLLSIVNISALVLNSYFKIETFVLNTYEVLKQKKDTSKQLYYQIHSVYIIANTLFRNKKFKNSLSYINEMEQLMLQENKKYYTDFILKFTLVKSLNLNFSGKQEEAIALNESINIKNHIDLEAALDLNLSLMMFYFQKGDIKKVKTLSAKYYHTDQWYIDKAGIDWVIKKNLMEILLYVELNDEDLLMSRLNSFKRRYRTHLKQINQERVLVFLSFVERYFKQPEEVTSNAFKESIEQSFKWLNINKEDLFAISFYAWLKNKIENSSLYKTTLSIINTS
jgi:hypothetical protein